MSRFKVPGEWHMPAEHVHPLLHDGGMVCLNTELGEWSPINRLRSVVLLAACDALEGLDLNWRELRYASLPDALTTQVLGDLASRKLIVAGPGSNPPFRQAKPIEAVAFTTAGSVMMTRPLVERRPPKTDLERLAAQSLEPTLELLENRPFAEFIREVRGLRSPNTVPATVSEATEVSQAVYQASDWYLGKVACLQRSALTAVVGAHVGLQIGLQLGARVDPIDYHAWPTAENQPVVLPHETEVEGFFHPVFAV